ncbi:hypothetical protein MAR_001813 [Mya arenaria]|uniref:CCHC-type domain-containing protein n=1 Tax=Mya arenaria TaxID=6604 RepID=A0ABY7FCV0_MYAAR|nr:hypothetical protein MAR_001813 [Mya arenaria]
MFFYGRSCSAVSAFKDYTRKSAHVSGSGGLGHAGSKYVHKIKNGDRILGLLVKLAMSNLWRSTIAEGVSSAVHFAVDTVMNSLNVSLIQTKSTEGKSKLGCWFCGRQGHFKRDCQEWKRLKGLGIKKNGNRQEN